MEKETLEKRNMKQGFEDLSAGTDPAKFCLRLSGYAFCPVCERHIELISFEDSAKIFKTDLQDIEFLAKRGDLHRIYNRNARLMVCSVSLFECFERRQTRLLDSGYFAKLASEWSQ